MTNNLSQAQIAHRAGISKSRVHQLLHRGESIQRILAGEYDRREYQPEVREYPYRTQALLGFPEKWIDVEVTAPGRTIAVQSSKTGGFCGLRVVVVQVDGESRPRRIAVERLRERP